MAIEILTAALVLITAYYARQNRAMVVEMQRARAAHVVPKLVPTLRFLGGGHCFPRLINVGAGPALNVDVEIGFDPDGPKRRWVAPVVPHGEQHDFLIEVDGLDLTVADQLIERYATLRLDGAYEDALGQPFTVSEAIDIKEMWQLTKSANVLRPSDDPSTRELKEIRKELKSIAQSLEKLCRG